MLQAVWLVVHLIASAMSVPDVAAAGYAGDVSCTYEACMAKCSKLNGPTCNSYCDMKIRRRAVSAICTLQDDIGDTGSGPAD